VKSRNSNRTCYTRGVTWPWELQQAERWGRAHVRCWRSNLLPRSGLSRGCHFLCTLSSVNEMHI